VNSSDTLSIVNATGFPFSIAVDDSGAHGPSSDDNSPRRANSKLLRYYTGYFGPTGVPLRAGDRVEVDSVIYEVLSVPREIRKGRFPEGFGAQVLPLTFLYPFVGTIEEIGGADVALNVIFSKYAPNESSGSTGTYEDFDGEAPLDYASHLRINRQIRVGATSIYKIVTATVDKVAGYVDLTLRKSGAS